MRGRQFGLSLTVVGVLLWLCAGVAYANVYPSGVSVNATGLNTEPCGTASITYVLNENADGDGTNPGVKIEILDSTPAVVRTVTIARQSKGEHVFQWDGRKDDGSRAPNGNYTVRITATDFGYTVWTQISDDGNRYVQFEYPTGVAVNRNSTSSNFGRIYVAVGRVGTTVTGRPVGDGIYVIGADQSDFLPQGDVAFAGGVDWVTGTTSSPHKITVAPDDSVYITDWSDLHSGIWRCNANPQAVFDEILSNTGRTSTGLVAGLHGSVASVHIEGTGASTKLYTLDEDYNAGGGLGSVLRYDIGTGPFPWSTPPVEQTQDTTNVIQNMLMDVVRDEDGSWWVTQRRSTESVGAPALMRFLDGGTAPVYNSAADDNLPLLKSTYGSIDIDNGLNRLIMGTLGGWGVYIIDISDPANPVRTATIPQSGTTRDVAFDSAGNAYIVSNSSETLRIWSPPDGVNSHTTTAGSTIALNKAGSGGPTITDQPDSVTVCATDTATFTVAATGSNVTYKWKKNGASFIPEQTGTTLNMTGVTAEDNGTVITVEACDDNGVVVSQPAILNVGVSFLEAPLSQTVCQNTEATFTVNASGKGTLTYQWYKDSAPPDGTFELISGANTNTYVWSGVQGTDSGTQIRCEVTDSCATPVNSPTAVLTVLTGPMISLAYGRPTSTVDPATWDNEMWTVPGADNNFCRVSAAGRGTLTYQWVKDGVDLVDGGTEPVISGANAEIVRIDNIPASWNGAKITVRVTDDCGTRDSNVTPGGDAGIVDVNVRVATETGVVGGCNNGADDDGDLLVDCNDADCAFTSDCWPCNDPIADADNDDDVDQADFAVFQVCYTGPGTFTLDGMCKCFDRLIEDNQPGADNDVDDRDLKAFEACASAPGVAADPDCDAGPATVVINELSYSEYEGGEVREFVELYNYGDQPVDVTGWILRTSDTVGPPGDDNPDYRIGDTLHPSVILQPAGQPGCYWVVGTSQVPSNQIIGSQNLFENDNEAIQLLDATGDVIDTVVYERNKGPVAISPAEGGIWMNFTSAGKAADPSQEQSLARWIDGYDTGDNGRDFGVRVKTPGASNLGTGVLSTAYAVPNVDSGTPSDTVTGLVGAFYNAMVIDPGDTTTTVSVTTGDPPVTTYYPINPNAIGASPQGDKAIVAWDPTGGGNMVASDDVLANGASLDLYVYLDTTPYDPPGTPPPLTTGAESTTYGILGTTGMMIANDEFPNPDSAAGMNGDIVTSNGNTGIGWVYTKETSTNNPDLPVNPLPYLMSLTLCDFGNGGDSSGDPLAVPPPTTPRGPEDWKVIATINLAGQPSGWHRLKLSYNAATGAAHAEFDTQTFDFTTATNLVGGFYIGYRETLTDEPAVLRPPTFDSVP